MAEYKIEVNYTKRVNQRSTVTTSSPKDPMELALSALRDFYDGLYPGENYVPDSVTVDGVDYSREAIELYAKSKRDQRG